MTVEDAIKSGITRIRLPNWNEHAYVRFEIIDGTFRGPWFYLYDRPSQTALGVEIPQTILAIGCHFDDWEEFKGTLDESEQG